MIGLVVRADDERNANVVEEVGPRGAGSCDGIQPPVVWVTRLLVSSQNVVNGSAGAVRMSFGQREELSEIEPSSRAVASAATVPSFLVDRAFLF